MAVDADATSMPSGGRLHHLPSRVTARARHVDPPYLIDDNALTNDGNWLVDRGQQVETALYPVPYILVISMW